MHDSQNNLQQEGHICDCLMLSEQIGHSIILLIWLLRDNGVAVDCENAVVLCD
jgi:hypothetical protein